MPQDPTAALLRQLHDLRADLGALHRREAVLLDRIARLERTSRPDAEGAAKAAARPGWPIRRLPPRGAVPADQGREGQAVH